MRAVRIIESSFYKYKYLSVVQSDTKMAVRILIPTNQDYNCSGDLVLSTEQILWKVLNINNQAFQVVAEGIFDLDNPLHRSWFQPNANICFTVTNAFSSGRLSIIPVRRWCGDGEKTPDFCQRTGYDVIAQLYCWSNTDLIPDCPASFATAIDGQVFTNIDQNRIVRVDTEWMKRPDRSAFLEIFYKVSIKNNKNYLVFNVECVDNNGNPIDVNGVYNLEATAGYLPIKQIIMEHGKCEFGWIPLGLSHGEISVKLKDSQNYTCYVSTFSINE